MKFTKMHGCGNDYIFINCFHETIENPELLALRLSNRHFGIGGDGLILIDDSSIADYSMRMYNPDGSVGEMCGNAIRCVGKYLYENHMTNKTTITIETLAGIKTLFLTLNRETVIDVMVDMGKPIFTASLIPVDSSNDEVVEETMKVMDKEFQVTCVSMGNPHAVIFTKQVEHVDLQKYGLTLEHNLRFPNRTNVEFVQVLDRNNIKMRVWERGTGETLACGTGACACVMAGIKTKQLEDTVYVHVLGGKLKVDYDRKSDLVFLAGPAVKIYEGQI